MYRVSFEKISQKELGYLLGLFIGDGYSGYTKRNRHYTVEFHLNSVSDRDIIDYVVSLLRLITLNCLIAKDKRYNAVRVRVNSKEFMKFVRQKVTELKENKTLGGEYALDLISGFIDAEGYVKNGEILLTQKNKKTLELFKKLLEPDNLVRKFWPAKNYKGVGVIWRMRVSTRFKYLHHNSCKVKRVYSGAYP